MTLSSQSFEQLAPDVLYEYHLAKSFFCADDFSNKIFICYMYIHVSFFQISNLVSNCEKTRFLAHLSRRLTR